MTPNSSLYFLPAYLLSAFGYEFALFNMTVYVYDLTGSAANVGIFTALTLIPRLFSSYYGAIVDRCDRVKVFGVSAGMVGVLLIALGPIDDIVWIYGVWFAVCIFAGVIVNARTAIMAEVLVKDNPFRGNSIILVVLTTARILAPLLGGFIAAAWKAKRLMSFMSGLYFLTMAAGLLFRLPRSAGMGIGSARVPWSDIKEGLAYILRDDTLAYMAVVSVTHQLFMGLQLSLFVVYVKSFLSLGDAEYGLFMTALSLGSISGSILGPWIAKRAEGPKPIVWGLCLHYLLFAALGLLRDYHLILIAVFIDSLLLYMTVVRLHSARDRATGADIRGRVYGSIIAISTPFGVVSVLAGGHLAGVYGVEKVLTGAGILALSSLLMTQTIFSRYRSAAFEGAR